MILSRFTGWQLPVIEEMRIDDFEAWMLGADALAKELGNNDD